MTGIRLEGKVALITGAGGGFGRAMCKRFADEGARIVGMDIVDDCRDAFLDELGDCARFIQGDHAQHEDNKRALQCAVDTWGKLDILVNNAGIGWTGSFEDADDLALSRVLEANLLGHYRLSQAAVPLLLDGNLDEDLYRTIIFVSSGLGLYGTAKSAPYTISKHGVIGLMRSLAAEYGPRGLRVNAICPGISDTAVGRAAGAWGTPEEVFERLRKATQLRRLAEPVDVANTTVFLASDEARAIHSVALRVDGGAHV